MATLTNSIRLSKPTVGGDDGPIWPGLLNSDMDYIAQATNQSVTVAIPDANVTLVADGTSGDEARYGRYAFTGALTADRTVTLPATTKMGWATNSTTGGCYVILSAGSTTLYIGPGATMPFRCDGTNVVPLWDGYGVIERRTVTASAEQVMLLPTAYTRFRLTFEKTSVNTLSSFIAAQFSTNLGVSFVTTNQQFGIDLITTTVTGYSTNPVTMISLTTNLVASGSGGADGSFEIQPGGTSLDVTVRGTSTGANSAGNPFVRTSCGTADTNARANAMKVLAGSVGSLFTGNLILEGLPT
jgi:hypothetical protein